MSDDDGVYAKSGRRKDADEKIDQLCAMLAECGPRKKGDLCERLGWDMRTLNSVIVSADVPTVCVSGKSNTIVYLRSQEVELGCYISSIISPDACSGLMRMLREKLSDRTLAVVRMHFLTGKNGSSFGSESYYWHMLEKAGFAVGCNPTDDYKRISKGVEKNIKKGYEVFLEYWKSLKQNNNVNRNSGQR